MKAKMLLLSLALAGAPAFGADLLQMYREALTYDAQYDAAKSALEAGREKLPQGRAGLLPTISGTANTTHNDVDFEQRASGATQSSARYNSSGYQVSLTQPLFRWQNFMQYQQGKLQVVQAEAQFAQAKQDLALRVSQAYFDSLLAQESLALAGAQKKAIGEQLEQAKRNFEVGTATITDSNEAQARFDLTTAQEIAAENDLEIKRQALNQVIGKVPDVLKGLRPQVQLQRPQPDDMTKWVEAAEQNNPLVAVQQAALEIADREVGKQRAGHYPTIDLVAARGRNSNTGALAFGGIAAGTAIPGSDTTSTTVGLQLNLPIFAGGATASRDREAVALRDKARADLDNVRRSAAQSARQAYLGATSGMSQVKAYEQALISSQSALDSNKLGYEVGVRINIDVLNAQQQLYSTRRDLAKAYFDTLLAQLRLKAAAGTLGEEDIQAINALLVQ